MNSENRNAIESREETISLIQKAREGSLDALDILKSKYHPLIESQVSRAYADYMSNQDREDLYEEAVSAFVNAVCNYNCDESQVEFGLYAKVCISNKLITFIRKYNSGVAHVVASLDELSQFISQDGQTDPLQQVIEDEKIRTLVDTIQSHLSPYEAKVWWLYTSGLSAKAIADKVGSDARSVNNAVYRIRKKLRQLLSD